MNGEWFFLVIVPWILSLALPYIAYRLGLRSQRIQALREYITEMVKDIYPSLFSEFLFNSELLDRYPEEPNVNFNFPKLDDLYNSGLEVFMKRHHKDLFLMVDSFRKNILPNFYELKVRKLMEKLFDISSNFLRESLPKEAVDTSERIASDLAKSINPYYIIPDLLTGRDDEARNKIEKCIMDRTSHIRREKAKRRFVIRGQTEGINYEEISQSLLEKAKPEARSLINAYGELKKQNDKEVKEKLLPLLQKYISNPI